MRLEYDKLQDAIHYICERNNQLNGTLDDVRLNKVLWYSDALTYMTRGQSITGTKYIRKPRGPVAKYHNRAITELLEDECIKEGQVFSHNEGRHRPTFDSIKPADKSKFSGADLQIFDQVYQYVCTEVSTREISDQSHGEIWELAKENEELPLYTVFAERLGELTTADIEEARIGFK